MDAIDALEAELVRDPYAPLREHLAINDDELLEALVAMRKSKRLTQDEVAERMNRSKTAVSNFERLGSDPHLSTIRRYAAAVGGKIWTRLADFDDEIDEPEALEVLYTAVPKPDHVARPYRVPVETWESVK